MTVQAHKTNVNRDGKSLDEWIPPQDAIKFIHSSINFCDEMDSHNYILDYDGTITGTTGITDHPLSNIANHDFDTYWQAEVATPDDDQYFEIELSEAVYCDSYIMNFHKPQEYRTAPYTPYPNCWKAWTIKGKLLSGDSWTTLETVTANVLKFYHGAFTRGEYKYFRFESISAYDDTGQSNRIDAYLYTMGIYDSINKYHDTFPDVRRSINDKDLNAESTDFTGHYVYINEMDMLISDVYDINGELSKIIKGVTRRKYRHIGGIWTEYYHELSLVDYPQDLKFTRINSLDFVANSGICLYMFPPPNEIWWFINSGYAFDETSDNLNTPILLKSPDNSCKISPSLTTVRTYSAYSILGARYKDTSSGVFKTGKFYITFSDNTNMESQIKFDGQECKGLITDMDGTALTSSAYASSNVNVARLKIGDIWRGKQAHIRFEPPIKLDGDDTTETFELQKSGKILGSVFRFALRGFKVPK